jgi:hypothetical protein
MLLVVFAGGDPDKSVRVAFQPGVSTTIQQVPFRDRAPQLDEMEKSKFSVLMNVGPGFCVLCSQCQCADLIGVFPPNFQQSLQSSQFGIAAIEAALHARSRSVARI